MNFAMSAEFSSSELGPSSWSQPSALHVPIAPPTRCDFSKTTGVTPAPRRCHAAVSPVIPAPSTATTGALLDGVPGSFGGIDKRKEDRHAYPSADLAATLVSRFEFPSRDARDGRIIESTV